LSPALYFNKKFRFVVFFMHRMSSDLMQKHRSCCARMERLCSVPSTSLCPASTHWWTKQWKTHWWLSRCMRMPGKSYASAVAFSIVAFICLVFFPKVLLVLLVTGPYFLSGLEIQALELCFMLISLWCFWMLRGSLYITVVWFSIEYSCMFRWDGIEWTRSEAPRGIDNDWPFLTQSLDWKGKKE